MAIFMWLLYTSKYAWERLERETLKTLETKTKRLNQKVAGI